MSEQADRLNQTLRDRGVLPPGEPPRVGDDEEGGRPELPSLELPRDGRGLDDFAREAGMVTRLNGVFVREDVPVTINHSNGDVREMSADRFRTYLADLAFVFKWKSGGGKGQPPEAVKVTMTKDTASGTLCADQFVQAQRPLLKVNKVRQPVMRKDGRIELLPIGYDAESGIFTVANEIVMDEGMEVEAARAMLTDLLREFNFPDWLEVPVAERKDSLYLARQVALMMGFYGSSLIPLHALRQGGFMNANREGSGKGLLVRLILMPVLGMTSFGEKPESPEELKKQLDSVVVSGLQYVTIDDIAPGNLKSQSLNSFMTSSWRAVRMMHSQRMVNMPVFATVYMTGHSVTLTGDLVRRCLEVKLQMEEANVACHRVTREITDTWLMAAGTRGQICSALWALVRHWDKCGRPKGPTVKGGWLEWCEVFGGIVAAAGFGDAIAQPAAEESPDPEYADMQALVAHFFPEDEKAPVPVVEVSFDQMVEACLYINAFEWMMDGRWRGGGKGEDGTELAKWFEPSPKCNTKLGKLWSLKYGGAIFRLTGGRVVRFGKRGKNRHKRYTLTLEG